MPAKVQIPEYFQEKAIFADSKEPGLKATSDKYMWFSRGGPPGQTSVLFEYDPSRKKKVPLRLLEDFSGYLQTDGYSGYNAVCIKNNATSAGCWSMPAESSGKHKVHNPGIKKLKAR